MPEDPSDLIGHLLELEKEHTLAVLRDYAPSVSSLEHSLTAVIDLALRINAIDKTGWRAWKQVAFVNYVKAQRVSFAAFRLSCIGFPTESLVLQRTHYEMLVGNAFGACHPDKADAGKAITPTGIKPSSFVQQELRCDFSSVHDRLAIHAHGLKGDVVQDLFAAWKRELKGGIHPGFGYNAPRVGTAFSVMNFLRWIDAALLRDFFPELGQYAGETYDAMVTDLRSHLGERGKEQAKLVDEGDHFLRVVRAAVVGDNWKSVAKSRTR